MLVTGHQPNYLPYPGFFAKIARADLFIVVDNTQFVKRGRFGWIHRNRIKNGKSWGWLTVPVLTRGKFTQSIRETAIENSTPWTRKHWRTIELAYRKTPYFDVYAEELHAVYQRRWDWLWQLNLELTRLILKWLDISTPVKVASEIGIEGRATDLVLDICRKTGANRYLSGVHGRDYLDCERFDKEGIGLEFQDYQCPEYPQTPAEPFIANLSTIDLLFNCGADSRRIISGTSD
ncbi:MAG: WbqC family protein [Proteobacteria bacterium]|nr:WbqC family protein [Pseudomonadota bacterium]